MDGRMDGGRLDACKTVKARKPCANLRKRATAAADYPHFGPLILLSFYDRPISPQRAGRIAPPLRAHCPRLLMVVHCSTIFTAVRLIYIVYIYSSIIRKIYTWVLSIYYIYMIAWLTLFSYYREHWVFAINQITKLNCRMQCLTVRITAI